MLKSVAMREGRGALFSMSCGDFHLRVCRDWKVRIRRPEELGGSDSQSDGFKAVIESARAVFDAGRRGARVSILELLDADVFNISVENCACFLDQLIESWDIDLTGFKIEIVLNRRLAIGHFKKLEFVEMEQDGLLDEEPGLKEFLRIPSMSGDVTSNEIESLKKLRFNGSRPTALHCYHELQGLRDPLNFRPVLIHTPPTKTNGPSQPHGPIAPLQEDRAATGLEKQLQLNGTKRATRLWAGNKGNRRKE